MKPIVWEKRGRIILPEEGPAWRRHMSGAVHAMPFENDRYRVYLTGGGEDVPTPLGEPGRRQIGWLEMDRQFNIIHENPANPVLTAGEGGASPGKNALLPGTTAAFTSATEPYGFAVLCQLAASRRPCYAILVHRPAGFPLPSFPRSVTLSELASGGSSVMSS